MRRFVITLLLLILVFPAARIAAQEQQQQDGENESDLYVTTVYANRVLTHRLGYKVLYQQEDLTLGEAFLPSRWFGATTGKAEMVSTFSDAAPYMEIYYRNGEFAYVRLYVRSDPNHVSWGSLKPGEATAEDFQHEALALTY